MRKIYSATDADDEEIMVCEGCIDDDMDIIGEVDPDCVCDECGYHPLSGGQLE